MGEKGGGQSKTNPLELHGGFNGDYRVKLTPDKLRYFCQINWPALGVGWPFEGSLNKVIVDRVFKVV
jgi:hypothetical protein